MSCPTDVLSLFLYKDLWKEQDHTWGLVPSAEQQSELDSDFLSWPNVDVSNSDGLKFFKF